MASRQLRKLQRQKELLNRQHVAADKSGEESSADEPIVMKPRGNMFSGFGALQDDNEDNNESSEEEPAHQAHREQAVEQAAPAKTKKKSKKKKKKATQNKPSAPAQDELKSIDLADRVLEKLSLEARPPGGSVVAAPDDDKPTNTLDKLLRINLRHLKAMNEMRMIFGKAIDVAELEQRTEENRRRFRRGDEIDLETLLSGAVQYFDLGPHDNRRSGNLPGGGGRIFEAALRTNPFVEGKRTWPSGSSLGLKMIRISDESQDEVEFAFAHDNNYDSLEANFFGLVQMLDPVRIVTFLHQHPYHVSSLIQVSKIARQDQNSALAADLIERAIFTFGRVSLKGFRKKLEAGQARMSFARPENRQFYLAASNLIQKLTMKGTYLTALEWSKLLLSLNHDDPYATVNWIHVLAIRAHEPEWFIDFCNSPFFDDPSNVYAKQSMPLAYLQLGDNRNAMNALIHGMKTLPWLYCALFSALHLDTPQAVWGIQPRDDNEALHTQLYIHMAKDVWNTPVRISLLQQAAATIGTAISTNNLPPPVPVSLATTRLVYLDNTPELMAAVPRGLLHSASPSFEFDPFPPARDDNVFSSPVQRLPWAVAETEDTRARQLAATRDAVAGGAPVVDAGNAAAPEAAAGAGAATDASAGGAGGRATAPGILSYLASLITGRSDEPQMGDWEAEDRYYDYEDEDEFEDADGFEGEDDFEGETGRQ